jgi:diaminopimelate decarboxylase
VTEGPWPSTATRDATGELVVGGVGVGGLARNHGTPLWVVDEVDLRERCRTYRRGFPGIDVAYASKAWCVTAILQVVDEEGLLVDVASAGELHTALAAGIDPSRLILHGNNKSRAELDRALEVGVGRIVIDSFDELDRLESVAAARGVVATSWLRITPGIDAHTHDYVRTGHDDSKFGFTLSLGLADEALARALDYAHVDVVGIHAHIGSQILGVEPFVANAEVALDLLARWRDVSGVTLTEVNLGGGMGIAYTH